MSAVCNTVDVKMVNQVRSGGLGRGGSLTVIGEMKISSRCVSTHPGKLVENI